MFRPVFQPKPDSLEPVIPLVTRLINRIDEYIREARTHDVKIFGRTLNTKHKGNGIKRAEDYKAYLQQSENNKETLIKKVFADIENMDNGRLGTSTDLREKLVCTLFEEIGVSGADIQEIKNDIYRQSAAVAAATMGYYNAAVIDKQILADLIAKLKARMVSAGHVVDAKGDIEMVTRKVV